MCHWVVEMKLQTLRLWSAVIVLSNERIVELYSELVVLLVDCPSVLLVIVNSLRRYAVEISDYWWLHVSCFV